MFHVEHGGLRRLSLSHVPRGTSNLRPLWRAVLSRVSRSPMTLRRPAGGVGSTMADQTSIRTEEQLLERLQALQAELAEMHAQLEHVQRLATIGTLSAGVLHEVNNMLTPALAYSQMASRRPSDIPMMRKAIDRSVTGIQGASEILQAILVFANPADQQAPHASVKEALQRATECLGRDLGKDQIALKATVPASLVATIRPVALQQILLNLLLNASRELRKAGGGRIEVDASCLPGAVVIQVSDNGPGVAEHLQGRIFEPFVSGASDDASEPRGGSGLGLSMCRHLVEQQGGSITFSETEGGGATFTIRLPAPTAQAAAA